MNSVVTLRGVSFEFPNGRELFKNLNLTLQPGRTALVGPNGIGKTTLAKILTGELKPTDGQVLNRVGVKSFAQREDPPDLSIGEYLSDYEWSAVGANLLADLEWSQACASLSGGQWMRVRLARTLGAGTLILDEPTNDLDQEGRAAVFDFLRAREGVTLIISHDRELLALCENIAELSSQGLKTYGGGWAGYENERTYERDQLGRSLTAAKRQGAAAVSKRTEALARQEKRNKRGVAAAAKGGESKLLLGRRKRAAQASTGKIEVRTSEQTDETIRQQAQAFKDLKVDPVMYASLLGEKIPAQKIIAEACGFNVRFGNWLYANDLDLQWRGNIRLALRGPNGSGKSVCKSGDLRALYLDQTHSRLDPKKSIFENLKSSAQLTDTEIRNGLARFLITGDAVFKKAGDLSGGERLRAALAQAALAIEAPELLILDEPTNNLDLINIEFLEKIVAAFRGPVIVVSHDEKFIENCGIEEEFRLK